MSRVYGKCSIDVCVKHSMIKGKEVTALHGTWDCLPNVDKSGRIIIRIRSKGLLGR